MLCLLLCSFLTLCEYAAWLGRVPQLHADVLLSADVDWMHLSSFAMYEKQQSCQGVCYLTCMVLSTFIQCLLQFG